MKTVLKMLAICMMAGGLGVQSVYAEPLVIQEQGSFSAGGTIITAPGTFDAKKPLDSAGQTYHGDHASVFYQIPENPHKYPIVMLHGAASLLVPGKVRRMVVKDFRTYSCAADSPRILSISRVGVMPDVPL